ncbi:MAG: L,D-transpeptidase family protein, partial [Turicibacter sp.]
GDGEAKRLLSELENKNHIRLKPNQDKPWYYYFLWFLLFMYLLIFFFFLGQRAIVNSTGLSNPYITVDNPFEIKELTPAKNIVALSAKNDYSAHEPLLIIRNALYQYILETGVFPTHLSDLTENYPNHYLSTIPNNPLSGTNESHSVQNFEGGWYYAPYIDSTLPLTELVTKSVQPNTPNSNTNYFSLLGLYISTKDQQLYLADDNYIYYQFPIAVGQFNQTPLGNFTISQKLVNPRNDIPLEENPYGTRLLELSNPDYAIHGTNSPDSIGTATTNGCIRLDNNAIDLLFAMTPLNTTVTIAKTTDELWDNMETNPIPFQENSTENAISLYEAIISSDETNTDNSNDLYETLQAIFAPETPPIQPSDDNKQTNPTIKKEWRG